MIKTRLIGLVPESKKYIFFNVLLQWIGMLSNVVMILTIAELFERLQNGQETDLTVNFSIILFAVVVRAVCLKLAATASFHASKSVKQVLRGKIFEKVLKLGGAYKEQISTAEVVQLSGEGVEQLETYFGSYLPQFFYAILAPITLFAVMSRISMRVSLALLICVPLIPISIIIVQKIAKRLLSKYWGQYAVLGDNFLENLQGLTTLKIYKADAQRHEEMNREAEHFRIITMKVLSMQLNSIIVMDIIAYGGAALGIVLALLEFQSGSVGLSGCLAIILLSADFFLPMRQLGSFFHVAMNGMAASDKIFNLLDLPVEDKKNLIPENNKISIEKLSFAYNNSSKILHNICMEFNPGSFSALVGESGCGKSTIASILTGKHTEYLGNIFIGGKELSGVSEDELMRRITLISHNSYLFKGTVRENLMMAKSDAKDSELWNCLERVNLSDFIKNEGGLELKLNEGASNLSGGQRQRLALARALLHDSPVLIFDEATSNVDVESENDIMKLIRELAHIKTIILISHRLANIVDADRIYVLEKGKVIENGTHEQLLNNDKCYARLWEKQRMLENIIEEVSE